MSFPAITNISTISNKILPPSYILSFFLVEFLTGFINIDKIPLFQISVARNHANFYTESRSALVGRTGISRRFGE